MDGVAHVQPVRPAPVDGGRAAADERGVGNSSAPALLHTLRTRLSMDAASYLIQARATSCTRQMRTCSRGRSQYSWKTRARHHPAPSRPTQCTTEGGQPPYTPLCMLHSSGSSPGSPPSRRPPMSLAAGPTRTCPAPSPGPGAQTTAGRPSGKSARAAPCSPSSLRPGGTRSGSWRPPLHTSTGQHPCPVPPSRRPRSGTRYTPCCGPRIHRRQGRPPGAAPPSNARRHPRVQIPEHRPGLGTMAQRMG